MIGVIADDLTGAAELGAVGLQHGWRAEILLPGSDAETSLLSAANGLQTAQVGVPDGPADLVCIDTRSRSCTAEEAGRRAANAAALLRHAGARWIYKKVDSVLRGQVTAEVLAVMGQLQLRRALLVPANPSLGRSIRRGRYYIQGKPIHKTEFSRDPEHPRVFSDVLKLLNAEPTSSICVRGKADSLPGTGIVIGEAARREDLRQWAVRRMPKTLAAGGAEFFGARLASMGRRRGAKACGWSGGIALKSKELFVCGTLSRSARAFVSAARAARIPVFSLPKELVWGADFMSPASEAISQKIADAFRSHPRVIINVGLRVVQDPAIARRFVAHLAQLAGTVLRQAEVGHVYAEGGATAEELAHCLGWRRLRVLKELAPGVATLAVADGSNLRLTIKPGSYVWPDEVQRLELLGFSDGNSLMLNAGPVAWELPTARKPLQRTLR